MADLSITAANVATGAGAKVLRGTAGATVTAGDACYLDGADGRFKLGDCTTSAATAKVVGIALNGASAGQPLALITSGALTAGATLTVGEVYVLSEAGGIAPEGDLLSDDYVTVLGVGISATVLAVNIQVSGVQVP